MASHVGSLSHDQNLNIHYNASAGGKTNVSKAPRKGVQGGRKPLGDLSNSVKPTPNQSLKKHNSSITNKGIGSSLITFDGSKKKSLSIAPEKLQTSNRKALCDISNSGKPHLHEASKKNLKAKLSVATEEHLSAIAEERFLHNHGECIKAQMKAMDLDDFRRILGLHNDLPRQSSSSLDKLKNRPASSPRYLDLEEIIEPQDFRSPQKKEDFYVLDSPPPCKNPRSPDHFMHWEEDANFTLNKTP